MSETRIAPAESSRQLLHRYLSIPPERRLSVVEDNLNTLVQAMMKEEPGEVGVKLNTVAVMLDIVREIRQIKVQLGMSSADHSNGSTSEQLESPVLLRIEPMPDSEIP